MAAIIQKYMQDNALYCIFNHERFRHQRNFVDQKQEFAFEDLCKYMWDYFRDRKYFNDTTLLPIIAMMLRDILEIHFNIVTLEVVHRHVNTFDFSDEMFHDYMLIANVKNKPFADKMEMLQFLQRVIDMYYRSKSMKHVTHAEADGNERVKPVMQDMWNLLYA